MYHINNVVGFFGGNWRKHEKEVQLLPFYLVIIEILISSTCIARK